MEQRRSSLVTMKTTAVFGRIAPQLKNMRFAPKFIPTIQADLALLRPLNTERLSVQASPMPSNLRA
ncbi:hypothetical protein Sinac_2327 [Singulisphaera acidiphila DSM 18658]|uniref:Uncharacterized protein n=1 Tax=Singulisphaera acidiphila (strain ATCC BAA-1392 / DSM 18658 / VKM B-2454 / MOB10) TaxID=886293 RepID=L0DB76_SINAD|nr:hypothetical protein Sinac_2327 [Singulisphaera acidiphila DSM 18658]